MKLKSFVSHLMRSVAAIAVIVSVGALPSCKDCDDDTVDNEVITPLSKPASATVNTVTEEEALVGWSAVSGAYNYTAQLKLSSYGSVVKEIIVDGSLSEVTFGELTPATTYLFRVCANDEYNEAKNSAFTDFVEFTTKAIDPQYTPLDAPKNVLCNSERTTSSSLEFRWDAVDFAASYTYKINAIGASTIRYGVIRADGTRAEGDSNTVVAAIDGLDGNTEYSFQVRANAADNSDRYRSGGWSDAIAAATMTALGVPVATVADDQTTASSLKFEWSKVAGAASYTYRYAKEGEDWGTEVETTLNEVVLTELTEKSVYKFQVKAVPVANSKEYGASEFCASVLGTTLSAGAQPIAVPTDIKAEAAYNKLTVSWSAVDYAASYAYQFGEEGESVEVTEPSAVVSGLEPETAYKVRVMALPAADDGEHTASAWSEWATLTTSARRSAITVSTATELKDALSELVDGGTITLQSGDYIMTSGGTEETPYALASIVIDRNMTLAGAAGSEAKINAKVVSIANDATNITIDNINLSAFDIDTATGALLTTVGTSSYAIDIASGKTIENLTVKNCTVHDIHCSLVRADRLSSGVGGVKNLTVTDNLCYNMGGKQCWISGNASTATAWVITGNTVEGIGVYNSAGKQRIITLPNASATFTATVENNTFANCLNGTNPAIDTRSTGDCGAIKVNRNIFYYVGADACNGLSLGSNGAVEAADNCVWNPWATETTAATGTINEDPMFKDAAALNFSVGNSNVADKQCGDKRWIDGVVAINETFDNADTVNPVSWLTAETSTDVTLPSGTWTGINATIPKAGDKGDNSLMLCGKSSKRDCTIATPALGNGLSNATATLSFNAVTYDNNNFCTVKVSVTGGGTIASFTGEDAKVQPATVGGTSIQFQPKARTDQAAISTELQSTGAVVIVIEGATAATQVVFQAIADGGDTPNYTADNTANAGAAAAHRICIDNLKVVAK